MQFSQKPSSHFNFTWRERTSIERINCRPDRQGANQRTVLSKTLSGEVAAVVVSVALLVNPVKAYDTMTWQGLLRCGIEADGESVLPSISLDLDGSILGMKAGLTVSTSGFTEDDAKRKGSFQATISREMERWLFKAEGYNRTTGLEESDEDGRVWGVDLSARDISLGQRPAVLEGGLKLRERTLPGRPESEYRETGYVFQTGFRLNDSPSLLLREFEPLWVSGLSGWLHDAHSEEEDLSLPEWFMAEEFSRLRPEWSGLMDAALIPDDAEPPKRTYTAAVQREYLSRDYTVGQERDSEYCRNTVSLSEQSGDLRASLDRVTTQRHYPVESGDEYSSQQVSLRAVLTTRPARAAEGRGETPASGHADVAAWEVEGGIDEKEYPANSDQDYHQLRGQIGRSWGWTGKTTRELSWSAGARWREPADGVTQLRTSCELGGSAKAGARKGEWRAIYSEWRGQDGESIESDRRSVRVRVGGRLPLSERVSGAASIAQEWKSEYDSDLGWQPWRPETVGDMKLEVVF